MTIHILSAVEIGKMRTAGTMAAQVLEMISAHVRPGVSTEDLDRLCHRFITVDLDAIPAPLNYHGFPKSVCTSINNQVCHGIPGPKRLREGDILNIDVTVKKDGYHGDTSKMFLVTPLRCRPATLSCPAASNRRLSPVHLARHQHSQARRTPRRHRPRHRQPRPNQRLLRSARILRPRHRQPIPTPNHKYSTTASPAPASN